MAKKKDGKRSSEELRGRDETVEMNDMLDEMDEERAPRAMPFGVVKDNPIPAALIGAGLGWLIVQSFTGNGRDFRTVDDYEEDPWQSGSDRTWTEDDIEALEDVDDVGTSKVRRAAASVRDLAGRAKGTVAAGLDFDEDSDAAQFVSSARERIASTSRRAQAGIWESMERSPLGVGAIAFALGIAGGLAIPTTRWEDERMGLASSTLKREAKGAARDIGQTARRVAKDAARAAGRDARNLGGTGTVSERAKHVVESARAAALEAARREDIANSVRDRARGAISQMKDSSNRGSDSY